MKQKRFKNYLKIGVSLFGIYFTLTNCQKDDDFQIQNNKHETKSEININKMYSFDINEKPNIKSKILEIKNKIKSTVKESINSKVIYFNDTDFFINTNICTYIENEDATYHSYTFPIYRTQSNGYLENLLISLQQDGTYKAFLVTYDLTEQQLEQIDNNKAIVGEYDFNFSNLDNLDFSDVFNKILFNEETQCWESSTTYHSNPWGTWEYHGTCPHEEGYCYEYTLTSQFGCHSSNGGDGTPDAGPNDNTNNSGGNINTDYTSATSCKGRNCIESEDEGLIKECNKIKKIIQEYNQEYIAKVRELKNKDSLNFESSVVVFEDNSVVEYQGVDNASTVQTLPAAPGTNYISVAHVHNETNSIKTYSVPSLSDLEWIARKYKDGYLNSTNFVAFLSTADGTYFALTINSGNKLWEFFKYLDASNTAVTEEERRNAAVYYTEIYEPILKKYYDDETNPLIKENAQGIANNEQQIKYFMQFLEQADAGIIVFETDENFNTFTELTLNNNNNVERNENPCQF